MIRDADTIEPNISEAWPSRPTIETVAHLQVCDRIESERGTIEAMRFETPLAEHWSALTEPLPLAGVTAMRPAADGGFPALDAVSAAAPWASALVVDIAHGLRLQLALGRAWVQFDPILLVAYPAWASRGWPAAWRRPSAYPARCWSSATPLTTANCLARRGDSATPSLPGR